MDTPHKDTWTWGVFAGLMAWILLDSFFWGAIVALIVGYFVEDAKKKEKMKDE